MAESSGVSQSGGGGESAASGKKGNWFKRNKTVVLIGGGVGAVLLLSHKGNSAGSSADAQTADSAENQALSDELSAIESGQLTPGGYATDTGGDSGSTPDTSGTDTTGTTNSDGTVSTDPNSGLQTPIQVGPIDVSTPTSTEPAATKKKTTAKKKTAGTKTAKKAGTSNKGKTATHANPHASKSGGHGAVVHGRTFPGAKSATVTAINGNQDRVTVNYGGHTDTHTSINKGAAWKDHSGGPPSRKSVASPPKPTAVGPNSTTAVRAPAPHPAARKPTPAPARRAAPARRR